ncbi:fibronectin type III domain-containing protein [Marinitoga lauensis]|uniref:fibronectin type III domain-containing protein n=1 Tax=Marinitoga lauensis TaxID=2201189 RepID=UPI00101047C4|nr:fibronectin type III domain-containing protein [Marinitoga lauensis]
MYDINAGKFIKTITFEENYTNLKLSNDNVLLYSQNIIDIYKFDNTQFNKALNLNFNEKIKNIYTFKNAFIVNLENKIIIIDYSGKKLKEYKIKADIIDSNSRFMILKIDDILYLLSYNNQMIKIEDNIKNAFLNENKIYIEKNNELIIYDILTHDKKKLDIKFNYKTILFFKNKIILVGKKIYAIDSKGNLIWKHEFQNDNIISNIAITNYNTIIFSLFDSKYYKIVEIYDRDIIQKDKYRDLNLSLNSDITPETENNAENTLTSLPTPLIINPKYGEKIQAFNVSLEWVLPEYESTTVTYEIELKEISSGLIKNKKISNISNNKILLSLEPNTKYIWKIIAKDKGKMTQSKWATFSTDDLNFVLKRIKLSGNQLILDSKIKDNLIYFTGYTVTQKKNILKLLYSNISTKFLNLKAWDFGNHQDKYGTSISLTDDGTVIIGGFSSEKDIRGDMLLYSLSNDGKISWEITTGSSKRDTINDVYFDNDDEYIYLIGTIGTDNKGTNIQFAKYNPKGYRIWSGNLVDMSLKWSHIKKN